MSNNTSRTYAARLHQTATTAITSSLLVTVILWCGNTRGQDAFAPSASEMTFDDRVERAEKSGGTRETQQSVHNGLKWLVRNQKTDGSWSLKGPYADGAPHDNSAAATAMALLCFTADGHTHLRGEYQQSIDKAKDHLLGQQDAAGYFKAKTHERFYTQGIATMALCELYKLSDDAALRGPTQMAVNTIESAQSAEGGWRYSPRIDADTSVTVWVTHALCTARRANLTVQQKTLDAVPKFLDTTSSMNQSAYTYQPNGRPSPAMTAAGLHCRMLLGWNNENKSLVAGAKILADEYTMNPKDQDAYYWYHATQVERFIGGESWAKWNEKMQKVVPSLQVSAGEERGSWPSRNDQWGINSGRLYTTCLSIWCLQSYYREPYDR